MLFSGTSPYKTATWVGQDGKFNIYGYLNHSSTYYPGDDEYIGTVSESGNRTISVVGNYVGYRIVHTDGEPVMGGGQVLFQ